MIPDTVVEVDPSVYVIFHGCVPVNATLTVVLVLQIVPLPDIEAVGPEEIIKLVAVLQVGFVEHAA